MAPYRLALVSGTRVGIWQPNQLKEGSLEEGKSLTKFKDLMLGLALGMFAFESFSSARGAGLVWRQTP